MSDQEEFMQRSALSRRRFLIAGGGAAAAVAVLAACGDDDEETSDTGGTTDTTAAPQPSGGGDAEIVKLAAGLELLAVGTYKAALDAAQQGKLGQVPPAVATFVQTAQTQHQEAADKLNSVLQSAGAPPVTEPNAKLKPMVDQQFAQVRDVEGAAKLALDLEQTAAATYLNAIPALSSKDAKLLAGQLNINDMQHAAILNYVLGEYPVPDVFGKTDKAVKPG